MFGFAFGADFALPRGIKNPLQFGQGKSLIGVNRDDFLGLGLRVAHRVCRAAFLPVKHCNQQIAAIYKRTISLHHTAFRVVLAHANNRRALLNNIVIALFFRVRPAVCLRPTGDYRGELDVGVGLFQLQHNFRAPNIRAARHSAEKAARAVLYTLLNGFSKPFFEIIAKRVFFAWKRHFFGTIARE